ncbi:MAG: hypothetical protein CL808_02725 [Citromicrobium sp.]|nr:hypothetical protein [Citromicrobium sp.]
MRGMDRNTGKPIDGNAWISQAVGDVLTTPLGSRVMRRDYGSLLPMLLDQPLNPRTIIQLYAATAQAIARWLPTLKLSRVELVVGASGKADLLIEGHRTDTAPANALARLTIPLGRA